MIRDRTGEKFGSLTVISDTGSAQILCRCDCGREQSFPREITKPTYRGRLICNYCRGSDCVICGKRIPQTSGRVSITCCKEHAKQHARNKSKDYYHRVKDSSHFKSIRAQYLKRLREKFESDPGYYMLYRMRHMIALRRWREKLSGEKRDMFLSRQRQKRREWLSQLRADPDKYAEFKKRCREWYASLSDDDYLRIFGRIRKYRKHPYR